MNFKPRYVLVGEKSSYDLLEEAQDYMPHHCSWIVPKDAKQGDTVLILIGKAFVGEAVIRADAKPTDKSGEYVSTIGAIKLWGDGIAIETIQKLVPDWKYLSYPRSYVAVPAHIQQPLVDAINSDWDEVEDERRMDEESVGAPPQPIVRKLEEVISVPCGTSIHMSEATGVHACPNEYPWSSYRPTRYMALRHPGSFMRRVYRVEHTVILPRLAADLALVPEEFRTRVAAYIERRQREWNFTGNNFKFYILSLEDAIELTGPPRPEQPIQGHCYFWLSDLLSGEKVVQVSSKSSGLPPAVPLKPLKEALAIVEAEQVALASQIDEGDALIGDEVLVEEFDPETLNHARDYLARQIVSRRGQPAFRQKLLDAYEGQCAFTGYSPASALEAAHIIPYCGPDSDRVANGLLLRADIHSLFDQGLIAVDTSNPSQFTIVIAPALLDSSYKYLSGKAVRLPKNLVLRPSSKALEWHRKDAGL